MQDVTLDWLAHIHTRTSGSGEMSRDPTSTDGFKPPRAGNRAARMRVDSSLVLGAELGKQIRCHASIDLPRVAIQTQRPAEEQHVRLRPVVKQVSELRSCWTTKHLLHALVDRVVLPAERLADAQCSPLTLRHQAVLGDLPSHLSGHRHMAATTPLPGQRLVVARRRATRHRHCSDPSPRASHACIDTPTHRYSYLSSLYFCEYWKG